MTFSLLQSYDTRRKNNPIKPQNSKTMKREILDAKLCDLNLPVRVKEVLSCAEIMTVRQLVKHQPYELLVYRNFGRVSLQQLRMFLERADLWMGMTDEDIEAFIRKDIEWEKAHRGGIVIGARLDDNITRPERVIAPPKMKGLLVDIGRIQCKGEANAIDIEAFRKAMQDDAHAFCSIDHIVAYGTHQLVKRENDALENILRSHIDNPIVGEITKDKLKASGVSGIIRRKDLPLPEMEKTDKGIRYTLQSDMLGISQGDMLIQFSGARMLLCDIPCEWYEEKFDYTDN